MQKYNDWDKIQAASGETQVLPAGNYICKIKGAKIVTYDGKNGKFDKLEISVDIDEGEFKGFYANDYRNQAQWGDQKWKGCLRPYCPTNEDSDQDAGSDLRDIRYPGGHWYCAGKSGVSDNA